MVAMTMLDHQKTDIRTNFKDKDDDVFTVSQHKIYDSYIYL